MEKNNRQWLIAVVAALVGLFLGLLCGAVGGGAIGYLLGRGHPAAPAPLPEPQPARTPAPAPAPPQPRPTAPPQPDMPGNLMGALVVEVLPDTPAERAGLRPGDIITAVDAQEIGPDRPLSAVIQGYKPGDRVLLTVRRGLRETLRVDVQLAESPTNPGRGYLGVRVQDLAP